MFHDFCFVLTAAIKSTNPVAIEYRGTKHVFKKRLISIVKFVVNDLQVDAPSVSRRHAVIVNMGNEVWLHDLQSTVGTWVGGIQVRGKHPLMGVHDVTIGNASLRVWSRDDLIA